MKTYRVTIEPVDDLMTGFLNGVAAGVLTYVVLSIAFWVIVTYWEQSYEHA